MLPLVLALCTISSPIQKPATVTTAFSPNSYDLPYLSRFSKNYCPFSIAGPKAKLFSYSISDGDQEGSHLLFRFDKRVGQTTYIKSYKDGSKHYYITTREFLPKGKVIECVYQMLPGAKKLSLLDKNTF